MSHRFQKMHGLGNDFILMDDIDPNTVDLTNLSKLLCDRHLGIGADGLILVLASEIADIQMRIINSDGSEADMCGNGIRCFAKYLFENKIINKNTFTIETPAGIMIPELKTENDKVVSVRVNMGSPKLNSVEIPMSGAESSVVGHELSVDNEKINITSLLMGVPHTILFVEDVDNTDIEGIGSKVEKHPDFPEGTNVNFVQVINEEEIKIRTWERGAGCTLACGTGSSASVVASVLNGKTGKKVTVHLALGDLIIEWIGENVFMTGPATNVFSGEIEIKSDFNKTY